MTSRPIYIPLESGPKFVNVVHVEFDWHPGFSLQQTQKSIKSLHAAAEKQAGIANILEISTKSPLPLGTSLSAFNLTFETIRHKRRFSIESAYQGSKVFERGGPYLDLLEKPAREAKSDSRLRSSGALIGFRFLGVDWPLSPPTAFYDWLYINALRKQEHLLADAMRYSAFSDIAFNPTRSVNCQAHSAALCVALARRGLVTDVLSKKHSYLDVIGSQADLDLDGTIVALQRMKVTRPRKVYMAKAGLDDLKFPSWDAYKTVKSVVTRWRPDAHREEDLEQSLYKFLVGELPDVRITKPSGYDKNMGADIVIGDTLALEVKADMDSNRKYQELLEDLNELRRWAAGIIVLLVGRTDPKIVGSIESRASKYLKGQKIAVIQK